MTPRRWIAAAMVAGALPLVYALAGGLSPDERAVAAYVDAHQTEAVALLERLVNVNSGTHNLAGVRAVGRMLRAELEALGFQTRWIGGAAWQRAGHLVAEHPGSAPRILLVGHLDTVFETDSPFQTFQRIDAATATGPGVIDMKGGAVIMLQALRALRAAGVLKPMNLVVVMTGDEEAPGTPLAAARAPLVAAARGAQAAIGFEDGPGDSRYAVTARRGATAWTLTVTGTAAHSSQIFSRGVGPGAIFEAARVLNGFREQLSRDAHLTLSPGVALGGTAVEVDATGFRGSAAGRDNVVADRAVIIGDLRTGSLEQLDRAKRTMAAIVATSLPHTRSRLTFDDGYPPLAPSAGNARLLAIYNAASRDLGLGPVAAASPDGAGAADVAFVAGEVPMILDGVGLSGRDDHTARETADLTTLPVQAKRAAVLLLRLVARTPTTESSATSKPSVARVVAGR